MKTLIFSLIFSLVLCLCGCGESHTCQLCGDSFLGNANEYESGGETYILCNECYRPFKEAKK